MKVIKKIILCLLIVSARVQSMYAACEGVSCPDVGQCFTAMTLGNGPVTPFLFSDVPDTMGAVGPTQFVFVHNLGVRSFNKETGEPDNILDITQDSFFKSSLGVFDTRVRYDRHSKRWFAIGIDVADDFSGQNNNLYIAVSDTHKTDGVITACTSWNVFKLQHNLIPDTEGSFGDMGLFLDYPTLGIDQHALYIGGNMFNDGIQVTLYVVEKESLYCDDTPNIVAFRNLRSAESGPFTLQGADAVSDYDLGFGAIIATAFSIPDGPEDQLLYYRVHNPGFCNNTYPTLEGPISISVPTYGTELEETGPHKGNLDPALTKISLIDERLMNATLNVLPGSSKKHPKFRLYAAHISPVDKDGVLDVNTPENNDRIAIRWYEIKDLENTPVTEQVGNIFDPSEEFPRVFAVPTIMTNKRADLLLCASTSGEDNFIDIVCYRRFDSDPKNQVRDPLFLTSSQASYNYQRITRQEQRWGDYSYTSLDPEDDMTMWTIQQAALADSENADNYRLQVTEILAPNIIPPFSQVCGN